MIWLIPSKETAISQDHWAWFMEHYTTRMQKALFAEAVRLMGSREDAQDIMQEAMVRGASRCWQLRDEEKLFQWMVTIVRNLCFDAKKQRFRAKMCAMQLATGAVRTSVSLEERTITAEFEAELRAVRAVALAGKGNCANESNHQQVAQGDCRRAGSELSYNKIQIQPHDQENHESNEVTDMKKERITEARIQDMVNQPTPEEWMQLEDVKARAFAEYERRQAMEAQTAADKAARKKSRRLRTVIVCALAAALIVLPLVYTCLMPVTVSNANNFVRKATIWINDKLHLDIEIDEPLSSDGEMISDTEVTEATFTNFEDAAAYLGEPLLGLDCEETGLELEEISITMFPSAVYHIAQSYTQGDIKYTLTARKIVTEEIIIPMASTTDIMSEVGSLITWKTEVGQFASCIVDQVYIRIKTVSTDALALDVFKTLKYFN